MIIVRYFGSLREQLGRATDTVTFVENCTVLDVWQMTNQTPLPENILTAVNMDYVLRNHAVCDGDEVAFFPPVTGG